MSSFINDNFGDHYVLLFDLSSTQDATEIVQYPHLVEIH